MAKPVIKFIEYAKTRVVDYCNEVIGKPHKVPYYMDRLDKDIVIDEDYSKFIFWLINNYR